MSIDSAHPLYSEFMPDWQVMRDTYRGERHVKERGTTYLPPTAGMVEDGLSPGALGWQLYQSYRTRAVYHDYVADAVEAMVGMMHQKSPVIELPPQLEPMRERATIHGESLEQLLRRTNEQQLVTGRLGLLLDIPNTPTIDAPLPYIAMYRAESILNWDDGARDELTLPQLNLVVLDESEMERRADFTWAWQAKYRVLVLGDMEQNEGAGTYNVGVYRDTTFNAEALQTPKIRGKALQSLPFVVINTKDLVADPDDPPLLGLARLSLAIYRGEADYRQNLFLQGQDTLVVTGAVEDDYRVGAGATIVLPQGGDAKYIGVSADGLSEQREALVNDRQQAASRAGQLIHMGSKERESGEALTIRVAAQTATLVQIARTAAAGLETLLRQAAEWVGADPDAVRIQPNLDFSGRQMTGKDLVELMTAKTMGAPLSLQTIHGLAKNRGITEMEYEAELGLIEEEEPALTGTEEGGDPESGGPEE